MALKLIPEVREKTWHRLWSVRGIIATGVLAAIAAAWIVLPADWTAAVPEWIKATLALTTVGTAALTALARLVRQNLPPADGGEP